jgi:hypothetical protein
VLAEVHESCLLLRVGRRGREIVEVGFSVKRVIVEALKLYEETLAHV